MATDVIFYSLIYIILRVPLTHYYFSDTEQCSCANLFIFLSRLWSVFPLHGCNSRAQVKAVQVGGPIRARSASDCVQRLWKTEGFSAPGWSSKIGGNNNILLSPRGSLLHSQQHKTVIKHMQTMLRHSHLANSLLDAINLKWHTLRVLFRKPTAVGTHLELRACSVCQLCRDRTAVQFDLNTWSLSHGTACDLQVVNLAVRVCAFSQVRYLPPLPV